MALASSIFVFSGANEKNESRSVLWAFWKEKVFSFWKEKVFSFFGKKTRKVFLNAARYSQKKQGMSKNLDHYAAAVGKETNKAVLTGVMRSLGVEIIEDRGPCGICRENVVGYRKDRVKDHKNIYYHAACWDMRHPRK